MATEVGRHLPETSGGSRLHLEDADGFLSQRCRHSSDLRVGLMLGPVVCLHHLLYLYIYAFHFHADISNIFK